MPASVAGLQNRRAFLGADLLAVNGQGFGSHKNPYVVAPGFRFGRAVRRADRM
jgi:hypothetical protein